MKRFALFSLASGLALSALGCGGGASSGAAAPNPTAMQISQVAATRMDTAQPADLSAIDLAGLDPDDPDAFAMLLH